MKNKFFKVIFVLLILITFRNFTFAQEQFFFDIGEITITENGNKFIGKKRGSIKTNTNLTIIADEFIFYKNRNTLDAKGNVEIYDKKNNFEIFVNKIRYNKNDEILLTEGNSKSNLDSKYTFNSKDLIFDRKLMILKSKFKSLLIDNNLNLYEFDEFNYFYNTETIKANNINIEYKDSKIDKITKLNFSNGFFNIKNKEFIADKTKIFLEKDIFGNKENDPRIYGVSSKKEDDKIQLNKAVFTSCKINGNCTPWSISANKIIHDLKKKQLIYDDAIIKIYDKPVLYFPKFFHPDPSVKRQSGFLKPSLNKSQILGSSIQIPYFVNISDNSDFTVTPVLFNNDMFMFQNEYRVKKKNSYLITDFSYTDGYESNTTSSKNSISHLFAKFNLDLNWDKFNSSLLDVKIQKTNNDTYLKIFDTNLTNSLIKPDNFDNLHSNVELKLDNENYSFTSGFSVYENLQLKNSDRFQYIFPYYTFIKNLSYFKNLGNLNLTSSGDNNLKETNKLTSRVINDLNFASDTLFSNNGLLGNINLYIKNLNTLSKNDNVYKSSLQSEIINILELNTSYPLIKESLTSTSTITPKISFRINPSDMKNYENTDRRLNVKNLFDINRLGLNDTHESGKSITFGLDFKKQYLNDINKYFQLNLGTVLRTKEEKNIPKNTSLNQKSSNLLGEFDFNYNENINLNYSFALDNDYKTFKENSLSANLKIGKFNTEIEFLEENYNQNNENFIRNSLSYLIDKNNLIEFRTRRNREINLTEYYDLVYQYMNDCLTAAIKYKKSYYNDRDLKPSEDIMFTITLFPITSLEQVINN